MRTTDTFRQYIWLVNTIQKAKRITLEHIQELWIEEDLNDRKPLSRTTFYRLKIAIEDMFGIFIGCDATNGYEYYIKNEDVFHNNSTQIWMLQNLMVNNIIIDSRTIKDRLVLEEIPAGIEHLKTIISAIKKQSCTANDSSEL